MKTTRKIWYRTVIILLLGVIYFTLNPSTNAIFPKCPFLLCTGLKCPGCGSQRAIHSLLHLDIAAAMSYNFMLVASVPPVLLLAYCELRRKTNPKLYNRLNSTTLIWLVFTVLTSWWILRNVFGW